MLNTKTVWKLTRAAGSFLRPVSLSEARETLTRSLNTRDESFLSLVQKGIYEKKNSPYKSLLDAAGIGFADVSQLVRAKGIEPTLRYLYDQQIYITLEEFKGLKRLRRLGVEISVRDSDFDNPLASNDFESYTGGSTGVRRRVVVDVAEWQRQSAAQLIFLEGSGVRQRPVGLWRPLSPGSVGLEKVFVYTKIGMPPERWFSQTPTKLNRESWPYHGLRAYMTVTARRWGLRQPKLEYIPLDQAVRVAQWLAKKNAQGQPAYMDTNVSSGARVCLAAQEEKLDISDTFFRFGSEPYTAGKAQLVTDLGCRAACHYIAGEAGTIGVACADPQAIDDVHLMSDSIAIIQQPKFLDAANPVDAFYVTSIRPSTSKLLLNVEYGDYGVIESRRCGCPLGEIGFEQHIHTIRSYEKLTTEGNHFLGKHLIELVEEVLPKKFGGGPTDFQLVESEQDGLTRVSIFVHPRLGPVNEKSLLSAAHEFLSSRGEGEDLMSHIWQAGDTLEVVRRPPYATAQSKIMPLQIIRQPDSPQGRAQ
ncbi:MAG: hypothetical protein OEU36_14580 [Gammaproteobacteria bacterium]|nr:hypothetical protein [Gammaproteobacteria bacterium]